MIEKAVIVCMKIEPIRVKLTNDLHRGTNKLEEEVEAVRLFREEEEVEAVRLFREGVWRRFERERSLEGVTLLYMEPTFANVIITAMSFGNKLNCSNQRVRTWQQQVQGHVQQHSLSMSFDNILSELNCSNQSVRTWQQQVQGHVQQHSLCVILLYMEPTSANVIIMAMLFDNILSKLNCSNQSVRTWQQQVQGHVQQHSLCVILLYMEPTSANVITVAMSFDILSEFNCSNQRVRTWQQQVQGHVQQHSLSGDPEKCNWTHRSGQGKHYQQQPQQQEQYDQKKQDEQQDLKHQGHHYQQPIHGQQDQLNREQLEQLSQGQRDHQNQRKQEKNKEAQRDQQLRQGQQDKQQQQCQQSKGDKKQHLRCVPVSDDANCNGYWLFGTLSGFFILFLLLPPASAQCSTCLDRRCYDTGQCKLGCVPGYMNPYCDEACPSNCVNNACDLNTTSGTITCSDGCEAGYCGTKCTRPCPEGCVTCDRQCGSCNKTLCPERRFGNGCKSVCSPNYEKCERDTGQCIKCRRGYYGDNCDLGCLACFHKGGNLMYKCLSGCEVCKEQEDSCPDGLFGANCELECSEKCGKSRHPCNKATGECSFGCVPGYHGVTCNDTCNRFCEGGLCNQHIGVNDMIISYPVLIILILCIVVSVPILVYLVRFIRRCRNSNTHEDSDTTESRSLTREVLP